MVDCKDVLDLFHRIRPFFLTVEEKLVLTLPLKDSDKKILNELVLRELKTYDKAVSVYVLLAYKL